MKRIYLTLVTFFVLVATTGCKKTSDNPSPESSYVSIVFNGIKSSTNLTNPTKNNYTFTATIISPKRVNIVEHGFIFSTSSSGSTSAPIEYKMGKTTNVGPVTYETTFDLTTVINQNSIQFFIDLEDGTRLTTSGVSGQTSSSPIPTLNTATLNIFDTGTGSIDFSIMLNQYDVNQYYILDYGIEFEQDGIYDYNGYAILGENLNAFRPITTAVEGSQTLFVSLVGGGLDVYSGLPYTGKLFIRFHDKKTQNIVTIDSGTFAFTGPYLP